MQLMTVGKAARLAQMAYLEPAVVNNAYSFTKTETKFTEQDDYMMTDSIEALQGCTAEPTFITDRASDMQAYFVFYPDLTVLAVRGTSTLTDALCDVQAVMCPFRSKLNPGVMEGCTARVHSGIFSQYVRLETMLQPYMAKMNMNHNEQLIAVGHSMGSNVATYASVVLGSIYPNRVSLFGFGSPRTGDAEFKALFQKHVTKVTLVKNSSDLIPKVYPGNVYQHVAEMRVCGKVDLYPSIPLLTDLPDHAIAEYIKNLGSLDEPRKQTPPEYWLGRFNKLIINHIVDKKREKLNK
jgi:predicted lipase